MSMEHQMATKKAWNWQQRKLAIGNNKEKLGNGNKEKQRKVDDFHHPTFTFASTSLFALADELG